MRISEKINNNITLLLIESGGEFNEYQMLFPSWVKVEMTVFMLKSVKTVNIKESDRKKELYNIMMDLNLDEKNNFDLIPYHEKSAKEFNYFGNNSAANIQIYAVRDVNSISNFWLGKRSGIFKNLLDHLSIGEPISC